jgi:hypothetical protein
LLSCNAFDILRRVRKLSLILATVFALSLAAFAAINITGTWTFTVDLGGQGGTPTFVLKQDGEKITGKYSGALGDSDLTGTLKGDKLAFDFDAQGAKVHYEGTVNADGTKIEGTCDYGGQASGTFKAERKPEK